MLIDTHCHLSDKDYEDIDMVIEDAKKAGVGKIIVSYCSKDDLDEFVKIKDRYDIAYFTLGFHPEFAQDITNDDLNNLKELLRFNKVVGVGEIGLDYHYGKENRDKQIWLFEEQLKIAESLDLPVVIHSRDATLDTINILKKYKTRGIIHCFSGSLETANIYIELGYFLGIGGVLTFKNSKLKDVIKEISLKSIVLETDSPYLTPVPFRGKVNSSKYLGLIANFIADVKGTSFSEVEKITFNNTHKLFDFNR